MSMSSTVSTATPSRPTSPSELRVVGVVAHERRHVEGDRQPGLALREQVLKARVGVLGRAEPREHPHRPQPASVHRWMDAAGKRILAGRPTCGAGIVRRFDPRARRPPGSRRSEIVLNRWTRSPTRSFTMTPLRTSRAAIRRSASSPPVPPHDKPLRGCRGSGAAKPEVHGGSDMRARQRLGVRRAALKNRVENFGVLIHRLGDALRPVRMRG